MNSAGSVNPSTSRTAFRFTSKFPVQLLDMYLTITTTQAPATDLGYLLHKRPGKLHSVSLSFGHAYVFYPETSEQRCTAAVLIEVDPVEPALLPSLV